MGWDGAGKLCITGCRVLITWGWGWGCIFSQRGDAQGCRMAQEQRQLLLPSLLPPFPPPPFQFLFLFLFLFLSFFFPGLNFSPVEANALAN